MNIYESKNAVKRTLQVLAFAIMAFSLLTGCAPATPSATETPIVMGTEPTITEIVDEDEVEVDLAAAPAAVILDQDGKWIPMDEIGNKEYSPEMQEAIAAALREAEDFGASLAQTDVLAEGDTGAGFARVVVVPNEELGTADWFLEMQAGSGYEGQLIVRSLVPEQPALFFDVSMRTGGWEFERTGVDTGRLFALGENGDIVAYIDYVPGEMVGYDWVNRPEDMMDGGVRQEYSEEMNGWVTVDKDGVAIGVWAEGEEHVFAWESLLEEWVPEVVEGEVGVIEPVFSMELVGKVEFEGGTIEIPLGIGLMQDLAEREVEPITGFSVSPERPDTADRLAYYYLRQCWHNHIKNYEENASMSWEEYLGEVNAGRGLIRVVVADPEVSGWDSPARPELKIVELSPLGGLTVYKADEIFGLDRIYASYVIENNGGLLMVVPEGSSELFLSQLSNVARNGSFVSTYLQSILKVLSVDMDKIVESGYYGSDSYVDLGSLSYKEYQKFLEDYIDFSNISQSRPYFSIEQ